MTEPASPLQQLVRSIVIFVGIMWAVFLANWLLHLNLEQWGVVPRRLSGLVGIPLSPFIHGSFGHLIGNTIPLVILLLLFLGSRRDPWLHIIELIFLSGVLLWLFGRNGDATDLRVHVGASGLIYGLIAYLIVAGFREKQLVSLAVAILVGFLYGGTLIWGLLPTQPDVSWDGHIAGVVAGGILGAAASTKSAPQNSDSDQPGTKLP